MARASSLVGPTVRRHLASLAILLCCVGGMVGWIGAVLVGWRIEIFTQDWTVYYAAGTAYLEGKLPLIFDSARFTAFQLRWSSPPLPLHPWLYPPDYLLLIVPFCLLPFAVAFAAFVLSTAAAAVAALARRGAALGMAWPRGIILLLFPACCIDALTGQNALLSAALLLGGFGALTSRPALAGAMLGALSYKPQLFLLVPVALLAARAWRALGATILAAAALALTSAAVFGLDSWRLWVDETLLARDPSYNAWFADTFVHGYSLYVCALLVGLPDALAKAVQLAASLAAAAAVYAAYRAPAADALKLAVLLAAALIAAPHVQAYDMVLPAAAAILLFDACSDGIGPGEIVLFGAVWILPLVRPFSLPSGRFLVPATLAALLAYALARALGTRAARYGCGDPASP